MVRRTFLVFIILVGTLAFSPPVAATPLDAGECIRSTANVETSHADINAVVRQAPNRSNVVRITYHGLSSGDRLEVDLPSDVTVIRSSGFSPAEGVATVKYTNGDPAVLEYQIGVDSGGAQYANGSNWLFAPAPRHIGSVGVDLVLEPNGVVGNEFLYIGNYTQYSVTDGCHEISLVSSVAGEIPDSPGRIIDALGYSARNLEVGHRYEEVTIFLTPGNAKPPSLGFAENSDAWVTKSAFADPRVSYTRLVLHEYVHTRQAYNRGAIGGMSWVIEGSAEYFSFKLARDVGAVSPEEYNAWLRNGSRTNAVLTDRSTWESRLTEYNRGGAYFAVLDYQIQSTSNRSLESVFQEINAMGGDDSNVLVQRSMFLESVENSSSASVREWANRSMDSAAPFNTTGAEVDVESTPVLGNLRSNFERGMAEEPYVWFVLALVLGAVLGMIPYEFKREQEGDEESQGESNE